MSKEFLRAALESVLFFPLGYQENIGVGVCLAVGFGVCLFVFSSLNLECTQSFLDIRYAGES